MVNNLLEYTVVAANDFPVPWAPDHSLKRDFQTKYLPLSRLCMYRLWPHLQCLFPITSCVLSHFVQRTHSLGHQVSLTAGYFVVSM
jgi:hypothetical protein